MTDTPRNNQLTNPELERLKIEHKIDLENKEIESEWKSCCFTTDKNMVLYFGQISFAFAVLAFSAAMLVRAEGRCDQSAPFINLISFLLGKLFSSVPSTK